MWKMSKLITQDSRAQLLTLIIHREQYSRSEEWELEIADICDPSDLALKGPELY